MKKLLLSGVILLIVAACSFLSVYTYKSLTTGYEIEAYSVYDIFRDLLVIVLAIAGSIITMGGYLVYRVLSKLIQTQAESVVKVAMCKNAAWWFTHLGYCHWINYKITNHADYLDQAIYFTEHALNKTRELVEHENELLICDIKNNLAYYLAERAERKKLGDREAAREYARYVYDRIGKYPAKKEAWIDTYKFVLRKYPDP